MKKSILWLLCLLLLIVFSASGCSNKTQSKSNSKDLQQSGSENGKSDTGNKDGQNGNSNNVNNNANNASNSNNSNNNTNSNNSSGTNANSKFSMFFGVFQLAVPGVSYTTDNIAANTTTITTSTGVQAGAIKINSDGTYIWNSSWDGKIINGKWQETGDSGYPIVILKGEEGKDWRIGQSNQSGSDIFVWDGSIWKVGKKVN